MDKLKLLAFDAEDLAVVSAHLQDAVFKVGDMALLQKDKRFVVLLNRFDWSRAITNGSEAFERRQCALRFERVLRAQTSGFDPGRKDDVLSLLALSFEAKMPDDPGGSITLYFAGDGAVRLQVECIEAELRDLGPAWRTTSMPAHPDDDPGQPERG